MNEEIEALRKELNRLTEEAECLYSEKIVKMSQKLDKLIYAYYKSTISM
ncbi:MAG: Spo0E like sporulation regulatory protein [Clostridiaceae bacterium]|nr:Spo0E like sporulation regulatory protein [Clostridiaceae bacterium]